MVKCGETKHPNDLLLTRLPVPPVCVRPSVISGLIRANAFEQINYIGSVISAFRSEIRYY